MCVRVGGYVTDRQTGDRQKEERERERSTTRVPYLPIAGETAGTDAGGDIGDTTGRDRLVDGKPSTSANGVVCCDDFVALSVCSTPNSVFTQHPVSASPVARDCRCPGGDRTVVLGHS